MNLMLSRVVEIFLVASLFRNQDKLQLDGPLGLCAEYPLCTIVYLWQRWVDMYMCSGGILSFGPSLSSKIQAAFLLIFAIGVEGENM